MHQPIAVFLALMFTSAHLPAQEGVLLRYDPPVGQVSRYLVTLTSEMDMPGGVAMSMRQTMHMTQRVTDAEGDVTTIEFVIDSVTDMSSSQEIPMSEMAGRMAGMTSTMRINQLGHLVEFVSGDSTIQAMLGEGGQFTPSVPGQVVFPERAVAPGETWADSGTTVTDMGVGRSEAWRNFTYRFERLEARAGRPVAVISLFGTIRQTMSAAQGGQQFGMRSDGSVSGELAFDLEAGRWVSNDLTISTLAESPQLEEPIGLTFTTRGVLREP